MTEYKRVGWVERSETRRNKQDSKLFPRPSVNTRHPASKNAGFTLLELLAVITLLSIVAGAVVIGYEDVQDQGREDMARFEMAEIRKALLQFRRDSGTRDFPGQGIYDCDDLADEVIADAPPSTWNSNVPVPTAGTKTDWVNWCQHPANFWMLFIDPLGNGWNEDTRRGWNGPYLQRKSGFLDIGDNLSTTGTGSPFVGNTIDNVWGIASPFIPKVDYLFIWSNFADPTTNGYKEYKKVGTPYFLFDLNDDDDNNSDSEARIVNMGENDDYDSTEKDAPNCKQELDAHENPVDLVLCLLR